MNNGTGVSRGDRNRNARLSRLRAAVPTVNAIVGIDLADRKQMLVVTDHDSKVLARRLLAAGVPVEPQDRFGRTPLFRASRRVGDRSGEVVRVPMAAGADPDLQNHSHNSARSVAETTTNFDLMTFFGLD